MPGLHPHSFMRSCVFLAGAGAALTVAAHAAAQQPASAANTRPRYVEITAATATGDAADVLALEQKLEEAVVRGDVAFFDSRSSADFHFRHGDGWTRGEQTGGIEDDKKAFLKRIEDKEYLVHDLDQVKVEMHGDLALTYGRYVSLFMPRNRNPATPARLNTIWFERVYAKRNGQWQFLSHRTVHGPTVSPAGVDPTMVPASEVRSYVPGQPAIDVAPETFPPQSPEAAEVLEFEKQIGASIVNGGTAFFDRHTTPDFSMTHGDGWTRGTPPALVDDKASFLKRVASKSYLAHDFDSVKVEMHGDVAITYGRYVATLRGSAPERAWFSVWFQRIYQKRDGRWMYVSHRTVHGASYGPTRESVARK